jgi:hypothetical protein
MHDLRSQILDTTRLARPHAQDARKQDMMREPNYPPITCAYCGSSQHTTANCPGNTA